jgi:hypothetical protein
VEREALLVAVILVECGGWLLLLVLLDVAIVVLSYCRCGSFDCAAEAKAWTNEMNTFAIVSRLLFD